MTELRLPPPQPATPPPSVRLVAARDSRDQPTGDETETDTPVTPESAAPTQDPALVEMVHQLQQENAELQAYLDRVLEALAATAAESDLTHVIDDPLAPTQYQRAPKDVRDAERLLHEARPAEAATTGDETADEAPVRMRWVANGPNGADPVPSGQLRRRATDRIEARIEAAQQTLGELIYLLDREMRVRDEHQDTA